MKNKELINVSFKHLRRKENIIFIGIISLLIVILFILLTILNFGLTYKNIINKKSVEARTLIVFKDNKTEKQLDSISDIEHVVINVSDKYQNGYPFDSKEFETKELTGDIVLMPLFSNEDVMISAGRNINNKYEVLIPNKFYPHALFDKTGKDIIYMNQMLDGKSLIGKTITTYSEKDRPYRSILLEDDEYDKLYNEWVAKRKYITFTIVGTYDTSISLKEKDQIYGKVELIDELKSDIRGSTSGCDMEGVCEEKIAIYENRMIIVDEYKNLKEVENKLTELGFTYNELLYFDEVIFILLLSLPICIGLIFFIITITLLRNFIVKKIFTHKKDIGLLEVIGYSNKEITTIHIVENILLVIISTTISMIMFFIIELILKQYMHLFHEMEFYSLGFDIPYIYILLLLIVLFVLVIIIVKRYIDYLLKKNIVDLIGEEL